MITIKREVINDVPILNIAKESHFSKPLPTVIYYHGFNGEKESSLTLAYKIVQKNLRVVLPDGPLHGERNPDGNPLEKTPEFWNIITLSIEEVEAIKNYLEENNMLEKGRVGLGGTSMGGMVTYCSFRKHEWIKCAAVLMGTPFISERVDRDVNLFKEAGDLTITSEQIDQLKNMAKDLDLTKNLDTLEERPLFIWHGELDEIIPAEHSQRFYNMAKEKYKDESNIKYIEEKDRIHNISKLSMEEAAKWFAKHL